MESIDSFLLPTGLGLAALACLLLLAGFVRAFLFGNAYRRELRARARSLRMGRMLATLGVRLGTYLDKAGSVAVERHVHNCECCPNQQACDDFLDHRSGQDPDRFCPNHEALRVFAARPSPARLNPHLGS